MASLQIIRTTTRRPGEEKKCTCLSISWEIDIRGNEVNWNKGCGAGCRDVLLMWFFPWIWFPPSDHCAFDYLMSQVFSCSTDAATLRVNRRCVTTCLRATRCSVVQNDFTKAAVMIGRILCDWALPPAEPSSRALSFSCTPLRLTARVWFFFFSLFAKNKAVTLSSSQLSLSLLPGKPAAKTAQHRVLALGWRRRGGVGESSSLVMNATKLWGGSRLCCSQRRQIMQH